MASYKIGQIVELVEKPGYLTGISRGHIYVVNRISRSREGYIYLTILGEDGHAHDLLSNMFRVKQS